MCVMEMSVAYLPSKFRDLGGFRDLLFLLFLLGFSLSPDSLKVKELGAGGRRRADHIRNSNKYPPIFQTKDIGKLKCSNNTTK